MINNFQQYHKPSPMQFKHTRTDAQTHTHTHDFIINVLYVLTFKVNHFTTCFKLILALIYPLVLL